jgi:hypothetical protein
VRLRAIQRPDLRATVLGVAETYEAWAREIEKSAGEAERRRTRGSLRRITILSDLKKHFGIINRRPGPNGGDG